MEWKTIIMLYRDADGDVVCGRRLDSEAPPLDERAEYVTLSEAEAAVKNATAGAHPCCASDCPGWAKGPNAIAAERARILAIVLEVRRSAHTPSDGDCVKAACDEILRRLTAASETWEGK